MGAKYHIRFLFAIGQRCSCGRRAAGRQSKRAGASWSSYGWLQDAVAYLFEKDAADDSIGPAGPDNIDLDVARQIPHQINTITEAGQSPGVEHRTAVGVHDLNRFGSSSEVPIHGVERKLVNVAVAEVHVKAERAVAIPGRRNSPRSAPGLQGPGIRGAGRPRVVELILYRQGCIARDTLRVVGHRISIGSVNATPIALRARIRSHETGRRWYDQIHFRDARSSAIRTGRLDGHLRRCDGGRRGVQPCDGNTPSRGARRTD